MVLYRPEPRSGAAAEPIAGDARVVGLAISGLTPRSFDGHHSAMPSRPRSAGRRGEPSPRSPRSPRRARPKSAGVFRSCLDYEAREPSAPLDMTVGGKGVRPLPEYKGYCTSRKTDAARSVASLDIDAALEKALAALDRLAEGIENEKAGDAAAAAAKRAAAGAADADRFRDGRRPLRSANGDDHHHERAVGGPWPRADPKAPTKQIKVSTLDVRDRVRAARPTSAKVASRAKAERRSDAPEGSLSSSVSLRSISFPAISWDRPI